MNRILKNWLLATLLLMTAGGCLALTLSEAKDKGYVGEMTNGYLGSPQGKAVAEVSALMQQINAERRKQYLEISAKVGKPLNVIEQLAGQKAIGKTQPGHYIQAPNGGWQKK